MRLIKKYQSPGDVLSTSTKWIMSDPVYTNEVKQDQYGNYHYNDQPLHKIGDNKYALVEGQNVKSVFDLSPEAVKAVKFPKINLDTKGIFNVVKKLSSKLKLNPLDQPGLPSTGGAGYIPSVDLMNAVERTVYDYGTGGLPVDTVRQRLYNNMVPTSYDQWLRRFRTTVALNRRDPFEQMYPSVDPDKDVRYYRDNIFATYLKIPEDKRRGYEVNRVVPSRYRPSIGAENVQYYEIDPWGLDLYNEDANNEELWDKVYEKVKSPKAKRDNIWTSEYRPLNINENMTTFALGNYFGEHTVGRGYDDRGEYMSYYDLWNLDPEGTGNDNDIYHGDKSKGLGDPVYFYGRRYTDDYLKVPVRTHATYLPNLDVIGNRNKTYY